MFFSLIEFYNNFFFFSKKYQTQSQLYFRAQIQTTQQPTMPTSIAALTGEDLKLHARDGTIWCNLEEDVLMDGMTVLGITAGEYGSNTTMEEAYESEEKASIALKLTAQDQGVVAKFQALDEEIKTYTYNNFKETFPKAAEVPATREEFNNIF
jgi:hypothetical protein